MSDNHDEHDGDSEPDTDVITSAVIPPMYALIMHNDDYTTMEFVVWVLVNILNLSVATAYDLMMQIHEEGQAKVAVLPKEIAEMKALRIHQLAEQEEFPLLVTLVKETG